MFAGNHWGGPLEIHGDEAPDDDEQSRNLEADPALGRRRYLDQTQQSWLLEPQVASKRKDKYVDLGCFVCKRKLLWWVLGTLFFAFVVVGVPIIIAKSLPKHRRSPPPPDEYSKALHKALLFFNAQKYGTNRNFVFFVGFRLTAQQHTIRPRRKQIAGSRSQESTRKRKRGKKKKRRRDLLTSRVAVEPLRGSDLAAEVAIEAAWGLGSRR